MVSDSSLDITRFRKDSGNESGRVKEDKLIRTVVDDVVARVLVSLGLPPGQQCYIAVLHRMLYWNGHVRHRRCFMFVMWYIPL